MKARNCKKMMAIFIHFFCVMTQFHTDGAAANVVQKVGVDPANAIYFVEEQEIPLQNGYFEKAAAPGAATKIRVHLDTEPVFGDLDQDGDEDAVMFLVFDPGGSGTFYYVVAALKTEDGFRGTPAVLLGDRLTPRQLKIHNSVVMASYDDRLPNQPMTTTPSVAKSAYLFLKEGKLSHPQVLGEKDSIFEGWVTVGHEVRSFRPCSVSTAVWLSGHSPAFESIKAAYRENMTHIDRPYTPLFMVMSGQLIDPPIHGFGADYSVAIHVAQLIQVMPKGNCKSEFIVVDAPLPGAAISSPLKISGRAEGLWFFEGDFPVILFGPDNSILAQGYCTAKKDWKTERFVPFMGIVRFTNNNPNGGGILVLKKDNPTGNPKFDDAMQIPIIFK